MKILITILELLCGLGLILGSIHISAFVVSFLSNQKGETFLLFFILIPVFFLLGLLFIALGMRNLSNLKKK